MLNKIRSKIKANKYLLKPFLVLLGIYFVATLAIIMADVNYADDVGRTNFGYSGWSVFSRYTSALMALFLHADKYLTNISPLPQLLSLVFLAVASVILICLVAKKDIFKQKWTKWIWAVIAVTPLGLCPYMLECLSYQYDAPYMTLSVLFAVAPFLFRNQKRWIYVIALAIGAIGASTTYQASLGILLTVMVFMVFKEWNEGKPLKEILKFALWSIGGFLGGMLIFKFFMMTPRDMYVSNEMISFSEFIPKLIWHLNQYYTLVIKDFKVMWLAILAVIAISFVIIFILRSKRNKFLAGLIALVAIAAMLATTYAPYSILTKPLYATRAMFAIGGAIAIMGVYISYGRGKRIIFAIPAFAIAWCFFIFASTYGNALKEQTKYRDLQVSMVMSDLNDLLPDLGDNLKPIQATGQIDYAPAIKNMPEDTRYLVHRLLKSTYGRNVPWMAYQLTQASGFDGLFYELTIDLTNKDLPVLKDTKLYTIRGNEEGILVDFKGEKFDVNY